MASGDSRTIFGGSESDRASYLTGSDELIDYTCNPCYNRNNATVNAAFYCSVCDDYCCVSCLQVHNSFKTNNSHQIYGRDTVEKWGQQSRNSISLLPTEECPEHPGEWLKLICLNHTVLCCHACQVLNHRTCPDIKYLPNIAADIGESQDLSNIDHTIDQFLNFVDEMLESDKKTQKKIDQSKTEFLDTVKSIRKQAKDLFNTLEEKVTTEMDKCYAGTTTGLRQHFKDLNDTKDNLTQLQMTIQPSSTNNEAQLFIKMFIAQQKLPEIQNHMQELTRTPQTTNFSLTKDAKLQEMFSSVKSFGKVEEEITTIQKQPPNIKPLPLLQACQSRPSSSMPHLPPTPRQTRQKQTTTSSSGSPVATTSPSVPSSKPHNQQQTQLYTATNGRKINVKMSSDKFSCRIYGSCQMPDGDILLADFINQNVKRLSRNYEPTDYLSIPAFPTAICCIDDEEAVVTDVNNNIHFLSITSHKMSMTRSIGLNHHCGGIAYTNRRLFVSNSETMVYIYSTSGECLKTIDRGNNGLNLFSNSLRICVSPDGNKIYVADFLKGLVTLDSDGNHLSTYSSDNLQEACGVCVDIKGRVLVCGNQSHNIIQLEEGGHNEVGGVISGRDRIKNPRSLCIDDHNSRLVVSKGTRRTGSKYITVFDLKLID